MVALPTDFTGPVPKAWLTRGAWLSEAAVAFATSDVAPMQQMMDEGREAFKALRHGETPQAFMLSNRSKGDRARSLQGEELIAWRKYRGGLAALEMTVLARLRFGTLVAFGEFGRPGAGWHWIPVQCWMHLKVDPSTRDKATGEAGTYWHVRVIDLAREDLSPAPVPVVPLAPSRLNDASVDQIDAAISRAYREAAAAGEKPPNGRQLRALVKALLRVDNLSATQDEIDARSGRPEFKRLRPPAGRPPRTA